MKVSRSPSGRPSSKSRKDFGAGRAEVEFTARPFPELSAFSKACLELEDALHQPAMLPEGIADLLAFRVVAMSRF